MQIDQFTFPNIDINQLISGMIESLNLAPITSSTHMLWKCPKLTDVKTLNQPLDIQKKAHSFYCTFNICTERITLLWHDLESPVNLH